jgi:ribose transport system permease protein
MTSDEDPATELAGGGAVPVRVAPLVGPAGQESDPVKATPTRIDGGSTRAGGSYESVLNVASRYGIVIALAIMIVAFSIALPHTFPTLGNAKTIINSGAVTMLLALAATIPLRAGDFDLSIAGTMIVSATIVAQLTAHGTPWVLALVIVLLAGAFIGLVNAVLIVKIGLNGFVATLGTLTALEGLGLAISQGQVLTGVSAQVVNVATDNVFSLQAMSWYVWIIAIVLWYVFERTPSGRYLLFVGGNPRAALLAGLSVVKIRVVAFVAGGVISAFAGFLLAGSIGSVDASVAGQYLLQPYAAAFLGATTIAVGRFNALGTVVGLYLLTVGIAGLQLFGASDWVTNVFNGMALIVAITFAKLAATRRGTG